MKLNKISAIITALTVTVMCNLLTLVKPADASNIKLYVLAENNSLISFDATNPAISTKIAVTGVVGTLLGVDFRPTDGKLYGVTDTNGLYSIDPNNGSATFIKMLSPASFNGGLQSGFDFNPVPDRLRLVGSNDQNLRINVDTGAVITDGTLAYATGDTNAGANPNITAVAYTNSFPGEPAPTRTTTLFGIDSDLDILVRQAPPNAGILNTIGSLGIDFLPRGGFDIFSPSNGVNTAYAASGSTLYTINLITGAATKLGVIGNGNVNVLGLAATAVPEPGTVGALVGLGAIGLLSRRRTRVKSSN